MYVTGFLKSKFFFWDLPGKENSGKLFDSIHRIYPENFTICVLDLNVHVPRTFSAVRCSNRSDIRRPTIFPAKRADLFLKITAEY